MLPLWLTALVLARDTAQMGGIVWWRARMFGYRWPGAARFFDVDAQVAMPGSGGGGGDGGGSAPQGAVTPAAGTAAASDAASSGGSGGGGSLPMMRPHIVSKANTALVMGLVVACIGHQWVGLPAEEVLWGLEAAAAGTTAASGAIYARLWLQGRLLVGEREG
jgi:cardiolipin synthase